jgi:hypothetical protein
MFKTSLNRMMGFSKYPGELIKSIVGEIDMGMIQIYYSPYENRHGLINRYLLRKILL